MSKFKGGGGLATLEHKTLTDYDFLDFGCSKGDSMAAAQKVFRAGKGLGIDINPEKVRQAIENGQDAIVADVIELSQKYCDCVRFVVMSHFLEHLDGFRTAQRCIRSAVRLSREFVFITQPFFDADAYLFSKGLKFYWSDWHGHPYHMTSLELFKIFTSLQREGAIARFALYGRRPVTSSADKRIHSIHSPEDQHGFDGAQHPPKNIIRFNENDIFSETVAIGSISSRELLSELEKLTSCHKKIFDSDFPEQYCQPGQSHFKTSVFKRLQRVLAGKNNRNY